MRGYRYTTASTTCLRGRTSDMDLDKNQDSGNTTHTPHTHTRAMDSTPDLPSLAPPKTGGDMDRSPSSSMPSADTGTPLANRLHELLATIPLERISPSTQDTHIRKVPGCAIISFVSPSAPDSFKTGLKCDSMPPYIFNNKIYHSLKGSSRLTVTLCRVCHKETCKEHE